MSNALQVSLKIFLCVCMVFITPYPLRAGSQTASSSDSHVVLSDKEKQQIVYDQNLLYFGSVQHEYPEVASIAYDQELKTPTWKVTNSSLLDSDPFFMRTQSWVPSQDNSDCTQAKDGSVCFTKGKNSVTLAVGGHPKALKLEQAFTPILETREHVFLSPDSVQLFRNKLGDANESSPGEGLFFIAKGDLLFADGRPVPVFFFPLPGEGWIGGENLAFDFQITDQIVIYDDSGFGLPVDGHDIALMERTQRQNLILAMTFTLLDGDMDRETGALLPKPNITMSFGMILSGQATRAIDGVAANSQLKNQFEKIAKQVASEVFPVAFAGDPQNTGDKIDAQIAKRIDGEASAPKKIDWSYWKRWLANGVLWGGLGAASYAVYSPVDFSKMITAEMPHQILTVAKILGAVTVASVIMKYTIHRAHFKKIYPIHPDDGILRKLNQHHKGIMSELAYGLYFSLAVIPQGLRHGLAFLKERFLPRNKMVAKAWEETMGFQMRQSSRLPMNYRTQYLGWVLGLADCVQVFLFLMILGPWMMNQVGLGATMGYATAAFASAEVLRNCLSYIQTGAFGYSSEVKFIALGSAQAQAKRALQADGKNPEAEANRDELNHLTEMYLEVRFKTVGLPGKDEFLYDPITMIEGISKRSGFYSPSAKAAMPESKFVLEAGKWGLIHPALKLALKTANEMNAKSPSKIGSQTVRQLERALNERSNTKALLGGAWDAVTASWATENLHSAGLAEMYDHDLAVAEKMANPSPLVRVFAYTKGAFKYLAKDSTKWSRAIRETLFVMTNTAKSPEAYKHLPQLWRDKAESQEAAVLSAELFQRAFFSINEHDENMIAPAQELKNRFERTARRAVEAGVANEPSLADPFVKEVRVNELIFRLHGRDKQRREVLDFQPGKMSSGEKKVWAVVKEKVSEIWFADAVPQSDVTWNNMHAEYRDLKDPPRDESGSLPQGFVGMTSQQFASYRYKVTVAREFAKQVGLIAESPDNSEFVRKVVIEAVAKMELHMQAPTEIAYISKLSPQDREFYEAQVFSRFFIDSYVELAVHSADHLKPYSPEYPGRFQFVRKFAVKVKGGKFLNATARVAEAWFRNEESSYRADWKGWFNRNVPFFADGWKNFANNLRVMPYFLSLSYLTSWYVWQVHIPYALWGLTMIIGFVNPTFVEINNRIQKNFDLKPMADVPSKLIYGWFHGIMTNPEVIMVQAYSQPIVDSFDKHVVSPIRNIPNACRRALGSL